MTDIDHCAEIADTAIEELEAILKSEQGRRDQYDRQTGLQIEYAIKWVKRVSARIRALDPSPLNIKDNPVDMRFARAREILIELRDVVRGAGSSHWRSVMLQRIDDLIDPSSS